MMSRKMAKNFCLIMVFTLVFCACNQNSAAPAASGDKQETFAIYLAGATPGGGGVWDMVGAGLAEAIIRSNKGSSVTVVPGGGVSDIPVVSNKEAELGLSHSVIAAAGVSGEAPFEEAYPNIRGVAAFYPSQFQFIVNPKLGISSIREIKDNKIPIKLAVGDPGSTGELATKRILEAYGIAYTDIESWGGQVLFKDMGEAATMYGDEIINGFTLLTLAPAGPLQQVATDKPVQLLSIDADMVKVVHDTYGYAVDVVPKDAYPFLTEDVSSFGSYVVVVTSDDRTEQEIYQVTKAFIENIDYIRSIHNNLKDLQVADMINTGAELHPGAIKAFKEAGVL